MNSLPESSKSFEKVMLQTSAPESADDVSHKLFIAASEFEQLRSQLLKKPLLAAPPRAFIQFNSLPIEHQLAAIKGIESHLDFLRATKAQSIDAFDEVGMLKYALNKLSLLADFNLFNEITEGDVVEILDQDYAQVYRSFSCFALCNYSITELVTYPWYQLYERPSEVTKKLLEIGNEVLFGKSPYLQCENLIPAYTLRELMSADQEMFTIREKLCARIRSPLTDRIYGITVKKITPIGQSSVRFI